MNGFHKGFLQSCLFKAVFVNVVTYFKGEYRCPNSVSGAHPNLHSITNCIGSLSFRFFFTFSFFDFYYHRFFNSGRKISCLLAQQKQYQLNFLHYNLYTRVALHF